MNTPDMLTLAQETLRDITDFAPAAFSAQAQFAQAAATIALVERLDQIIGIMQAETGYGPIEINNPATPVKVRFSDDDPQFPGDGQPDIPY